MNALTHVFSQSVFPSAEEGRAARCCGMRSIKEAIYTIGTTLFSAMGNWPFFGVAASYGRRTSESYGTFLGISECSAYFLFRWKNCQDLKDQFFVDPPESALPDQEPTPTCSLRRVGSTAFKVSAAAISILAQFPFMVLAYYENDGNLLYPLAIGICEGVFTMLSLLMSAKSLSESSARKKNPILEQNRKQLIEQCDHFLKQLSLQTQDPNFVALLDALFISNDPQNLLNIVFNNEQQAPPSQNKADLVLTRLSLAFGALIALYILLGNATVTYRGAKNYRSDQEALAVFAVALVTLGNAKFLFQLCMSSAKNYYQTLRDLTLKRYQTPLAAQSSKTSWVFARAIVQTLAWFAFGTTAISMQDYTGRLGKALVPLAPVSAALTMSDELNAVVDRAFLSFHAKKSAAKLHLAVEQLKLQIELADPKTIEEFASQLPHFILSTKDGLDMPLLT